VSLLLFKPRGTPLEKQDLKNKNQQKGELK
jgi:hypothetical protein